MLAQVTSHAEHQKQTQIEQESFFFFFPTVIVLHFSELERNHIQL